MGLRRGIEPTVYTHYLYDASGNRVKKFTRTAGGTIESFVYIDGIIEYREDNNGNTQSITHIMDDTKRIASIRLGFDFGDSTPNIKYNLDDHLGSSNVLVDEYGTVVNFEEYYPFGETSFGSYAKKRYRFCGKEKDEDSGLYYYGARYYSPWLCRFVSVDPLVHLRVEWSPYNAMRCNPILNIDPTGALDYPIYSKNGVYLGDDGRTGGDLAFTGESDGKGRFTNLSLFTNNHTQFQTISNIVKHEGVTKDAKEYLWIAHTANNAANGSGKSLYGKLMSGFSSVAKSNKTALSISDNSTTANFARAGVIDVMSGGADPTGGATLWDGTDFLSWGLKSPNGTPQNKFEEYKSISISGDIYSGFLNSQLSNYSSGKVKYSGSYYKLPADVFTDKSNWDKGGNFIYSTGENQPYGLKASGTAGRSIFWKTEK